MTTLTREQIENARIHFHEIFSEAREDMDALCDLALRGLEQNSAAQALGNETAGSARTGLGSLTTPPASAEPKDKRICHAPVDRCLGCDHYYGKADVCAYAEPNAADQGRPVNSPPQEADKESGRATGDMPAAGGDSPWTDSIYLNIHELPSETFNRMRILAERLEALVYQQHEALKMAESARVRLAWLVEDPRKPNFSDAVPNVADQQALREAYAYLEDIRTESAAYERLKKEIERG